MVTCIGRVNARDVATPVLHSAVTAVATASAADEVMMVGLFASSPRLMSMFLNTLVSSNDRVA